MLLTVPETGTLKCVTAIVPDVLLLEACNETGTPTCNLLIGCFTCLRQWRTLMSTVVRKRLPMSWFCCPVVVWHVLKLTLTALKRQPTSCRRTTGDSGLNGISANWNMDLVA